MAKIKGSLTWGWLLPKESHGMSIYDSFGWRLGFNAPFLVVIGAVAIPLGVMVNPFWLLLFLPNLLHIAFAPLLPKLHYLNGLSKEQSRAIEWYRELSLDERKQLPVVWESVVRESGNEKAEAEGYFYRLLSVTEVLLSEGQQVIALYRERNKQPEITDYRVPAAIQLMNERKKELSGEINDQKEIEAEIARMV